MSRQRFGPLVDEPIPGEPDDIAVLDDGVGPTTVDEVEEPKPGAYGFPARMHGWRELVLVVAVLAVGTVLALRLWNAHFGVPFSYSGDGLLTAMCVKTIREHGWLLTNPRIGAPFHGQLFDFPTGGENVHWLSIKLLGLVTPSWIVTENLYFLATFVLVGVSAYFVARYLKLDLVPALVVATLYAFLPYHLAHGEAQVARGGYYIVPLGALLVLWVVDYRTRFFNIDDGHTRLPLAIRRPRWAFALVVCLFLGASDTQNTAFLGGLIALVALIVASSRRDLRPVAIGAVLVATMFGSLAVNNSPSVLYRMRHGPNTVATDRSLSDQDRYGLSLSRMLLPSRGYFFPPLAHVEETARTGALVQGEDGEALGVVASIGLLAGFLLVLSAAFRRRSRERIARAALIERLGAINLVAFLVATAGGLSFLLAVVGFKLLRTWNRMVVVIAFFALLTAGLLMQALLARWRTRGAATGAIALAVAALLLFGIFDQNPAALAPDYAHTAQTYEIDHGFFTALEARLPRSAMVFQYPIVEFPEAGTMFRMGDYEHFAGFLNTKTLRFSYGAMKGRPESDWQIVLGQLPLESQLAALSAVGFRAVEVNRDGYGDHGRDLDAALQSTLGPPIAESSDHRLVAYDLSSERSRVASAMTISERRVFVDAVLHPVTVTFGDGFYAEEGTATSPQRWARESSVLILDNLASHSVDTRLSAVFAGREGTLEIAGAGIHEHLALSEKTPWTAHVALPPGRSVIHLLAHNQRTIAGLDARELFVHVGDLTVWSDVVARAVCTFAPATPQASDCPRRRDAGPR